MISTQLITETLKQKITVTHIEIYDDSAKHAGHEGAKQSGGGHFAILIVSSDFEKLPPVARHRLIYSALQNELKSEIHALAIKTFTPEEYQKQNSEI